MSTWPSKFKILRDNFQESPVSNTIRSEMDVGPAKLRKRSVLYINNLTFSMYLKQDDYEEFKTFYRTNESVVFDFLRPDTKQTVPARFVSAPTASFLETLWQVNVQLEILP